tara:strand:- start:127 stop:381 length:255 start_codon:yes stop_codon:yes gene_type:complete
LIEQKVIDTLQISLMYTLLTPVTLLFCCCSIKKQQQKRGVMKSNQGGAKFSLVVVSVIVLGVSAWFNQANASEQPAQAIEVSQS